MSSSFSLPFIFTEPSAASTYKAAVPTPVSPNGTLGGALNVTATPSPSAFPSWWAGAGGPALIVVFTAVGLLAMGVVLLLVLRAVRTRQLDGFYDGDDDGFGSLTVSRKLRKKRFGEKPKIYDLPIAYYKGGEGKENVAKWNGIVPISATFMKAEADTPITSDPEKRASMMSRITTTSTYSDRASESVAHGAFNWRCLHAAPQLRDASVSTHEQELPPIPPSEIVPDKMQVAVAIAMPRPPPASTQHNQPTPSSPPGLRQPEPMPNLYLGFAQVRGVDGDEWKEVHSADP